MSVPLRTLRKQLEGKWHDRIMLDRLTGGIRYLSPHERIIAKRKKKKFGKSWLTKKEPTTMMRSWRKTMWLRKKRKVRKSKWNRRTKNMSCPSLR